MDQVMLENTNGIFPRIYVTSKNCIAHIQNWAVCNWKDYKVELIVFA